MTETNHLRTRVRYSQASLIIGLAALAVVGTAWLFELAGYHPCQLCLWQRIPYYMSGPLLLVFGLIGTTVPTGRKMIRPILVLSGVIFIGSAALGTYHSGVEWGFWPGPTTCGSAGNLIETNVNDLLSSLATIKPPSCTEASARFLGLSFAGWNVIASAGLAICCFLAVKLLGDTDR